MVNLFAHLGGIDEIGIYVVPVVVALPALRWVEKRAKAQDRETNGDGRTSDLKSDV